MTDNTSLFPDLPPAVKVTHWRPRWTVEAVHLDGESDWAAVAEWCGDAILGEQGGRAPDYGLHPAIRVWTEHGSVWATEGNWIVKGARRFPVVCETAAFADMYEQVTP